MTTPVKPEWDDLRLEGLSTPVRLPPGYRSGDELQLPLPFWRDAPSLRVSFIRDVGVYDPLGQAVVDEQGFVALTGFWPHEVARWTRRGLMVPSRDGWAVATLADGVLFLHA